MAITNTTYKNRLLKLAKHLKEGKLGHKLFDFSNYNSGKTKKDWENANDITPAYKCGYAGCAIGECPIVFKDHWQFGRISPQLKIKDYSRNNPNTYLSCYEILQYNTNGS